MKTNIKIGLLPRIIIAILLGIILGLFMPRAVVRVFVTFNSIFSNLLQFLIPLIIIGLVTPAISDIGKGAGKLLLITVLIAYCDTVFAGLLSYGTSVAVFPRLIGGTTAESVAEFENLEPYFTIQIPAMVDVMSALVFSFTLGLGMAFFGSPHLKKFADEFKDIIVKTIEVVIIPLLPIYIFGIFLGMTHTGCRLSCRCFSPSVSRSSRPAAGRSKVSCSSALRAESSAKTPSRLSGTCSPPISQPSGPLLQQRQSP